MKPTAKQITGAVEELGAIPFFPGDPGARHAIGLQLAHFVTDQQHLRWLVEAAVNGMRQWSGVADLRGLYCTRFKPGDGVEANCQLPGYTPADCEQDKIGPVDFKKLKETDQKAIDSLRRLA